MNYEVFFELVGVEGMLGIFILLLITKKPHHISKLKREEELYSLVVEHVGISIPSKYNN